jgi:hypothetical protein
MASPLLNREALDPASALLTHYLEIDERPLHARLSGDLIREMRAIPHGAGELALCAFAEIALDTIAHLTGGTKEQEWRTLLGALRSAMASADGGDQ